MKWHQKKRLKNIFLPAYQSILESGELDRKIEKAKELLSPCRLCPRTCKARRLKGETGFCKAPPAPVLAAVLPHFGEEPVLVGDKGCGTLFFSHCNLRCCYCQNYQISQEGLGETATEDSLAEEMLKLQQKGCHNIAWVSPTPHLPFLLSSLKLAAQQGLSLPVVYNTHGYESLEVMELLSGVVDIYLPDMKYGRDSEALTLSEVSDYVSLNRQAVEAMALQVGNLTFSEKGWALRGILVRHLVLPGGLSGTKEVLKFLAGLSPELWISLMAQYQPCHKARNHPVLNAPLTPEEYTTAIHGLEVLGFQNYFLQEIEARKQYLPDFAREVPILFPDTRYSALPEGEGD